MFESFWEVGDEGIFYGRVIEKSDKYLTVAMENGSITFIFHGNSVSEGDLVRVYVKNKRVIFIEKFKEIHFKKLKEILSEIKNL